jgi:hypothetical protein
MGSNIENIIIGSGFTICLLNWVLPDFTFDIKLRKRFFVISGGLFIGYRIFISQNRD